MHRWIRRDVRPRMLFAAPDDGGGSSERDEDRHYIVGSGAGTKGAL
jgi:hypothetical protein